MSCLAPGYFKVVPIDLPEDEGDRSQDPQRPLWGPLVQRISKQTSVVLPMDAVETKGCVALSLRCNYSDLAAMGKSGIGWIDLWLVSNEMWRWTVSSIYEVGTAQPLSLLFTRETQGAWIALRHLPQREMRPRCDARILFWHLPSHDSCQNILIMLNNLAIQRIPYISTGSLEQRHP